MGPAENFDLSGKDWLTVEESAFYCGVSVSQFYSRVEQYNLLPREFMGKKLYEKAELYEAIYSAQKWSKSQSTGGTASRISTGGTAVPEAASPSVASAHERLRRYDQRKKRS